MPELAFDVVLAVALVWVAWRALTSPRLFTAVVLFIAFGLLMALAWLRLGAPDIALAEAAIGAGITGALLLDAVAQTGEEQPRPGRPSRAVRAAGAGLAAVVGGGLAAATLALPREPGGLTVLAAQSLPDSGVTQPVTAVLLNFRGYDTWLELAVLVLAVLALLALRRAPDLAQVPLPPARDPVLTGAAALLVPLMVLTGGYLLWLGTHGPGGAFQAGAILAAAGILLRMAGRGNPTAIGRSGFYLALLSGVGAFLIAAVALLAAGRGLLEHPPGRAGLLIVLIEAAAAVAIGFTLAALVAGATPRHPEREG